MRREVAGRSAGGAGSRRRRRDGYSVFVAEKDERLQDTLREKFKGQGYRVFIAGDPLRALDRFRQQPYDALVVDARTTGEEGIHIFERVLKEAERSRLPLVGILILSKEQARQQQRLEIPEGAALMVGSPTMRQLRHKLEELLREREDGEARAAAGS